MLAAGGGSDFGSFYGRYLAPSPHGWHILWREGDLWMTWAPASAGAAPRTPTSGSVRLQSVPPGRLCHLGVARTGDGRLPVDPRYLTSLYVARRSHRGG
ncbi:unnamed protein product, partial [Musa banksii]